MLRSIALYLFLGTAVMLALPADSSAYIDPGSGFILLQVVIAAAVGGLLTFKRFWKKLFRKLPFVKSREDEASTDEM